MATRFLATLPILCGIVGTILLPGPAVGQHGNAQDPNALTTKFTGDFDQMEKRRLVRILVPFSKTIYFIDKGAQYGTVVDSGIERKGVLNADKRKEIETVRVAFVPVPRGKLLSALNEGAATSSWQN